MYFNSSKYNLFFNIVNRFLEESWFFIKRLVYIEILGLDLLMLFMWKMLSVGSGFWVWNCNYILKINFELVCIFLNLKNKILLK